MANFGEILSELRQDRSMTQKELAAMIFVTPGTVSNYENGTHYPYVQKLIDLADFFQVTVDYLLGRSHFVFSTDILEDHIGDGRTIGDVITAIKRLDNGRMNALLRVLDDMTLAAVIKDYNRRSER